MYLEISLNYLDFYVCFLLWTFFLVQTSMNSRKRPPWTFKAAKQSQGVTINPTSISWE